MNEASLIVVENLSRQFGDIEAVRDVSFRVERGEVLGFLGPNGAGKSTTMKMISGNLAPSAGRVTINGYDILDEPRHAKTAIGYLAEQPPLYRELTVDEYLIFCSRLNRIARAKVRAAVDVAKQRCGLTAVGKRLIGNLSKGFQQRVGIAQAIIHMPAVIVLDEPTVGLDPIQIREIRELIVELGKEHGVILSTHILPEVQAVCDHVQIIHQGELVLNDSIAGLQKRMQTSSLMIKLQRPPLLSELQNVASIEELEDLHDGRFRVHFQPDHSPAEDIVQASVAKNWGLVELSAEQMSLEKVFVDLTHGETVVTELSSDQMAVNE